MIRKKIETLDDMICYVQEYASDSIETEKECLVDRLEESTEFDRGRFFGFISAYQYVREHFHDLQKHGYSEKTVEDWSFLTKDDVT